MKRLIFSVYAVPALLVIGASLLPMEKVVVFLCGLLACAVTATITCPFVVFVRSKGQRCGPVLVGAVTCLAVIASVMTGHWPLRAAYFLSRPSLDRLAEDMRTGHPFAVPTRVG